MKTLLLIATIFLFVSCNKQDTPQPANSNNVELYDLKEIERNLLISTKGYVCQGGRFLKYDCMTDTEIEYFIENRKLLENNFKKNLDNEVAKWYRTSDPKIKEQIKDNINSVALDYVSVKLEHKHIREQNKCNCK
jgi:hypothetical protein